jgi:hypothetical protein
MIIVNEKINMEELFGMIQDEIGSLDEAELEDVGLTIQPLTGTDVC